MPNSSRKSAAKQSGLLRVGVAQMCPQVAQVATNLDKLEGFVDQAIEQDVDLLITPELAMTGYPMGPWFSSASIRASSPELARLKELSKRLPLIVGLIEETEEVEFFNSAVFLRNGEVEHLHRKIYLPTYREFDERRYFMAGWTVSAFDTPWCRMGVLICGDCWHLSLPYLLAHYGADVIIVLAASSIGGLTQAISSQDAWERMNRSYALTLSTFIAFANLVGDVQGTKFWGGSHTVLPDGRLLSQASFEEEELLVTTLDLKQLREQRLILPFRRDDSLSLTTELGREILSRKGQRVTGLRGTAGDPTVEPLRSPGQTRFPPSVATDIEYGQPARPESELSKGEDRDAN